MPFQPRGVTSFGGGFNLGYTAATETYSIAGEGISTTYGPTERDPASTATSQRYTRVVNGFTERFLINQPTVGGVNLDYTRSMTMITRLSPIGPPSTIQYSCIFGVPTLIGDAPPGSNIPFARVAFNGAAYIADTGSIQSYSLVGSTATLAANVTTGTVTVTLQLIGTLQTHSGPSGTPISLGEYRGTGFIDTAQVSFAGTLNDTAATPSMSGNFGGWFFGPQGAESGSVTVMFGTQPGGTRPMTVTGNLVAFRQ